MEQSDIVGPAKMIMPGSQQLLLALSILVGVIALVGLVVAVLLRWRRRRKGLRSRAPVVTGVLGGLLVLALAVGLINKPSGFFVPEFPALPQLFPDDAFFYREVRDVAVSERSEEIIASFGGFPVSPGASSEVRTGVVWGFPFNLVDDETPRHRMRFTYSGGSDDVPYPISEPAYIQSMPALGIDDHYIAIDLEARRMWELWAIRNWFGRWAAGSGAMWDLDSTDYAHGSTTASGLPMMPLVYTYEEVASGEIGHVLSAASSVIAPGNVWPARHSDGPSADPDAPPMGTWFRLKSGTDLSSLGPQARVIARAMIDYGMVLTDTTGNGYGLAGTPDARWDMDDLATLRNLSVDDLEVIESSQLMVMEDSMAAAPPG
ncbi:MAG: hypothetical protein ACK5O2_06130 [Microthrixaceae bacterium]